MATETNATTGHVLTGIPQIDYIWDPNLPRELNGYNLSDYPFYNSIPEDIDFKCDGLHDGFYASVPHKCQVRTTTVSVIILLDAVSIGWLFLAMKIGGLSLSLNNVSVSRNTLEATVA